MAETFGKKLKFLRERAQVTVTRLATATGLDKDFVRDLEAGRREPNDQTIGLFAEFFKVGRDYFGERDERKVKAAAPPARKPGAKGGGGALDFDDFDYFKEGEKFEQEKAEALEKVFRFPGEESQVIVVSSSDLADMSPVAAQPEPDADVDLPSRPASTPPAGTAKDAPPAPPTPRPATARAAMAPPAPPVAAARPALPPAAPPPIAPGASAEEILRALVDLFVKKGFFTRDEFEVAIRRARA